jgi:hypothetical protein
MKDNAVTFRRPDEVLAFIRECLQSDDVERLYSAVREQPTDFWRDRLVEDLREIDRASSLESVFLARRPSFFPEFPIPFARHRCFPRLATTFKLGGHSGPTKHLHIDLERNHGAWRLKKIWKCR